MAEVQSKQEIVKASPQVVEGEYMMDVRDFTPAGGSKVFAIAIPKTLDAKSASVMLRAAILKGTTWKDKSFPMVLHAVMYADNMGLDIMAGDVYMAEEGRLSTTAGAKIRHAMSTGRIEGYEVTITEGAALEIPYKTKDTPHVWKGKELVCTVVVYVTGWKKPVTYTAKLSEWFTGRNPNWRERPAYMLRMNALSKALSEVAPMGVDADEAPALDTPQEVVASLNKAKELVAATEAPTTTPKE